LYLFSKALKVFLYLVSSEERNKKATSKAKFKNHIFNYSKKLQITAIIFTLLKKNETKNKPIELIINTCKKKCVLSHEINRTRDFLLSSKLFLIFASLEELIIKC
jgi:hypothetical protein